MGKFHFTKDTVEASIWCNACNKVTLWKILQGKRGYCIRCYDRKASKPEEKPAETQISLFAAVPERKEP